MGTQPALAEAEPRAHPATGGAGATAATIAVIGAAVMVALGAIMSGEVDQPTWLDSAGGVVAFYHGSGYEVRVTGALLVGLGFLLLLVFIARLTDLIGTADPPSTWLGRLILAVAGVDAAVVLASVAAFTVPVWRAAHGGLSDEGFVILNDLQFAFGWLSLLVTAVWAMALGGAIVRTGLLSRWLGWAMLANGVVFLFGEFSPLVVWDVAYGLFLALLVLTGVLLAAGRHAEARLAVRRSRA